jgi:hypothetical protein
MHKPTGWPEGLAPAEAEVNGTKSGLPIERVGQDQGAMPLGDRAGAPDCESFELNLPSAGVSEKIKVAIHWIKRPAG